MTRPREDGGSTPALRPQLPPAERLLPYLQRIDESRIYSNWGPLSAELEGRLSSRLGLPAEGITTAASGTAALVGAVLAGAGRATGERPLAILPAFTFVATAVAVEQCGYRPYLVDVDADTWMLDPERLSGHAELGRAGVVVPVAPFGRPVDQARWEAFRAATGVPVAVDGGASFDRLGQERDRSIGSIPVAMSFHATKCFSTGEGGGVASTDTELVRRVTQALNFGFYEQRETTVASCNGKMSEYHAAVGLAELDGWPEKSLALSAVVGAYRRWLTDAGLADRLIAAPQVSASYVLLRCHDADEAESVRAALAAIGADCRRWYGRGLHHHGYYADLPRDDLPVTDRLAPGLLGLPLAPDLAESTVSRIVAALSEGVREPRLTAAPDPLAS